MADRQDLLALVMPLARALRRIEDGAAAEHDLTMWQYAILAVIDRRPGLNQGEVADTLGYSKNRIIADLDHLEAMGLLVRERAPDRRANTLTITAAGNSLHARIQSEIHRGEDDLLGGVPAATRRAFERTLRLVERDRLLH